MSEDRLRDNLTRGQYAKDLLENELLKEAFTALKAQYSHDLLNSKMDQTGDREKLYLAHRVLIEVERHVYQWIETGKLAQAQLDWLIDQEKQ